MNKANFPGLYNLALFGMENILIIKTGAAGDVVRTSSLLNILEGNIYWVTSSKNKTLLPDNLPALKIFSIDEASQALKNIPFNRVISLEENEDCARLASEKGQEEITGIYLDNGKISYTDNSARWFDMSRVSRLGLEKANMLKAENKLSYPHFIFEMLGKHFNGEPYMIYPGNSIPHQQKLFGIEKRSGVQWPCKQWWGYDELAAKLEDQGYPVRMFEQRNNIRDYLKDISECSHIISGDTLAMHVAMAYNKTCTAIFNCTSPHEIYDYGLLSKVVSPLLDKYFYSSANHKEVIESVPLDKVYKTLPL